MYYNIFNRIRIINSILNGASKQAASVDDGSKTSADNSGRKLVDSKHVQYVSIKLVLRYIKSFVNITESKR